MMTGISDVPEHSAIAGLMRASPAIARATFGLLR